MDKEWLEKQISDLRLDEMIMISDIPDIDLYMDQLITLFENKMSHTKRNQEDKLLTKTMINNYTKDKVLMPAFKKKYTREHIILMILLYQLKSIVSIADIKDIFSLIKEDEVDPEKLGAIYNAYMMCREKELEHFNEAIDERLSTIHTAMQSFEMEDKNIESALLIMTHIQQAAYHKRLAEKLIDEWTSK